MARKLLRARDADRDADLIVVTDEGYTLDPMLNLYEAKQVIAVLANKVRAFHKATEGIPSAQAVEIAWLQEIAGRLATTVAWVADGKGAAEGMRERAMADLAAWRGEE